VNVQLKLERAFSLPDFPSGSSINFRKGKLLLIGDDANNILLLDSDYNPLELIKLFDFNERRISKPYKSDLETSTVLTNAGADHLLILGSASTGNRERVIIIPFIDSNLDASSLRIINSAIFSSRLRTSGILEVNIEGSTAIGNKLVLSNRGNRNNTTNHIILTETNFWEHQATVALTIIPLQIPDMIDIIPGVSELCFLAELDLLLIALSSESTNNAYDDGAIGDSYLGWIKNISKKITAPIVTVDEIINLSSIHADFKNEKIEGLCIESLTGEQLILHLVSDNDKGVSKLFKLKLNISH
jgi:hypothetical protein